MKRAFAIIVAIVAVLFSLVTAPAAQAQRETVYAQFLEEDPADRAGISLAGEVQWLLQKRTATGEMKISAAIEIPARQLAVSLTIIPNSDPAVSASHLIEISLALPKNFRHGDVSQVAGIIMRENEKIQGTRLIGQVAELRPNVFRVGLAQANVQRNGELLYWGRWLDVAFRFVNGRRAILGIQTGTILKQAFAPLVEKGR